jgi:threonine synthase
MMPVRAEEHRISLGEGGTPLVRTKQLEKEIGHRRLFIKDESGNPTGSFKARGLGAAVARARELGAARFSIPSAGNAAGALSAYAAYAGATADVYLPKDAPPLFIAECRAYGATVHLVDGLITDCGRRAAEEGAGQGWFDISTLKEPYRIEGKKTMGYEIAEQLGWELPDVIIYPTGGGTGLIGMWKAFGEMEELGWIGPKRPRMIAVQSSGCAPIVRALKDGVRHAEPWRNARTVADGLRVPAAVGDFLILEAIRASGGAALAVDDEQMISAVRLLASTEGIFAAPEGGATLAALQILRKREEIGPDDKVVLLNTGSGIKYYHLFR